MSFNRITFEYPEGWIDKHSDPLALQHIKCLNTIRSAAMELNIDFKVAVCPRMADFAQRYSTNDTLLISVHTVGVAHNVVRLKESYLPGLYYFDRSGYSGWAELAYNTDLQKKAVIYDVYNAGKFVGDIRAKKIRENSSKYPQPNVASSNESSSLAGKQYILLALQTSDDLVACLSAIDQLVLAEALAEALVKTGCSLVLKRHPLCRDFKVETTIRRLKKNYENVLVSMDSINPLIHGAKAVVTVNSGVGFEALVMGTPVITAGRSDYSFVTHNITKPDDLAGLQKMFYVPDDVGVASMIKFYVDEYCITCGDVQKAVKFINRWKSEDYSNMFNLGEYEDCVLRDIQNYVVQLEKKRRHDCMTNKKLNIYEKVIRGIRTLISSQLQ